MDRSNHYELAFEAYLRERRLCYIAVDEARRSLLDDGTVKITDFGPAKRLDWNGSQRDGSFLPHSSQ